MSGSGIGFALRLARRDLRGGIGHFRVFLACLVLGVAAIAGVGSAVSAMNAALAAQSRSLLGGDLEFRLAGRPASPEETAFFASKGQISSVVEMRTMARRIADPGPARPGAAVTAPETLAELKAVDGAYPLYGALILVPAMSPARAFGRQDGIAGCVVDAALLSRLGLAIGDRLAIGQEVFTVRGTIAGEPDRSADRLLLGPRVMIGTDAITATGLVQRGSLITWAYRLHLAPGIAATAVAAEAARRFPAAGWKVTDAAHGAPGLRRWLDRLGLFLTLAGLSALLIGGVGIGNAVKSHLESKITTIATLKCLGAPRRLIFQTYLAQVLVLALAGTAIGMAIGAAIGALAPMLLAWSLGGPLPIRPEAALYLEPLLRALAFGLLTALAFALWPLARATDLPAAALFRSLVSPPRRLPPLWPLLISAGAVLALAALALAGPFDHRMTAGFLGWTAASFVLLRLAAACLAWAARRSGSVRGKVWRLAVAALRRPGSGNAGILLSLGSGLAVLASVSLIQGNLARQVAEVLPANAPAFFFADIQESELAPLQALLHRLPGVREGEIVPMLRGRIIALNGRPAASARVAPGARWALDSDRGLTYAARLPAGSSLVAGRWWPPDYRGPPLVSFDAGLARDMGLKPGDTLMINLLGRDIVARIANLRRIDWASLGINFALVFAPGTLEAAPHTYLASADATRSAAPALYAGISDSFPNISVIGVRDVLATLGGLLATLGRVMQAAAALSLVAGILVLAGALAASQRQRLAEAMILKVLGATRAQILGRFALEYALLGLVAGLFAALLAEAASYLVVAEMMGLPWQAQPYRLAAILAAGLLVTLTLGLLSTAGRLKSPTRAATLFP